MKQYSLQLLKVQRSKIKRSLKQHKKMFKTTKTKIYKDFIESSEALIADLEIAIEILDNSKCYNIK